MAISSFRRKTMVTIKTPRKRTQINVSLEPERMADLIQNLSILLDGQEVCTLSEAVERAAQIATAQKEKPKS
jgi:hypothetical protein